MVPRQLWERTLSQNILMFIDKTPIVSTIVASIFSLPIICRFSVSVVLSLGTAEKAEARPEPSTTR